MILDYEPDEPPLTDQERKAIAALDRLAKRWPRSLTLASMGGTVIVFRTDDPVWESPDAGTERGETVIWSDVGHIPNTGGDW